MLTPIHRIYFFVPFLILLIFSGCCEVDMGAGASPEPISYGTRVSARLSDAYDLSFSGLDPEVTNYTRDGYTERNVEASAYVDFPDGKRYLCGIYIRVRQTPDKMIFDASNPNEVEKFVFSIEKTGLEDGELFDEYSENLEGSVEFTRLNDRYRDAAFQVSASSTFFPDKRITFTGSMITAIY